MTRICDESRIMFAEIFPFLASHSAAILAAGGLIIGLIFGAVVIATNFCTMGAIADIMTSADYRRFRAWVLAAAVALAGTQALDGAGVISLSQSIYLNGRINWFGSVAGGLVFGFGMVLAGGCPARNLARAGGGDMRALTTVLIMGLSASIAMTGLFAPMRLFAEQHTAIMLPKGTAGSLADLTALTFHLGSVEAVRLVLTSLGAGAVIVWCLSDAAFRRSARDILAGLVIGGCAIAGWALTSLGQDEFAIRPTQLTSVSFVRPVADSIDYVTLFTGMDSMGFGVALVIGTIFGAAAAALLTGRFRLQGFADQVDSWRNLVGAVLMGFGGVVAVGCSIGQGITGISTMAAASFLAFAAITSGAVLGIRWLERRV